jgi:hypothetical protein
MLIWHGGGGRGRGRGKIGKRGEWSSTNFWFHYFPPLGQILTQTTTTSTTSTVSTTTTTTSTTSTVSTTTTTSTTSTTSTCGLYYKHFTIIIYDRNDGMIVWTAL